MTSNDAQQHNIATLPTACFVAEDPPNLDPPEPAQRSPHHPANLTTTTAARDAGAEELTPYTQLLRVTIQKGSVEVCAVLSIAIDNSPTIRELRDKYPILAIFQDYE